MPRKPSEIIDDLIRKHMEMVTANRKLAYTLSNDCSDLKAELDAALRGMMVKIVANRLPDGVIG